MIEIKYEPLYGLQKPFDNGPDDANAYGFIHDGGVYVYYKIDKTSVYCFDTDNQWSHLDGQPTLPFLAMRRIIRTPTWTKADKKAGKLPEVGCRVFDAINETEAVVKAANKRQVCLESGDGFIYLLPPSDIKPIESPEEKSARLRNKWCNRAMDYSTIQELYDAMLSGELTMPNKDGE